MSITVTPLPPTIRAPAEDFSGHVLIEPVIRSPEPALLQGARVSFAPGARTAWHTHPAGQTLHVLSGHGIVQEWGEAARRIGPGDTFWIPPGVRHWHGARPDRAMVHLALQGEVDGSAADWLEQVTDADYAAAAGAA